MSEIASSTLWKKTTNGDIALGLRWAGTRAELEEERTRCLSELNEARAAYDRERAIAIRDGLFFEHHDSSTVARVTAASAAVARCDKVLRDMRDHDADQAALNGYLETALGPEAA